MELRYTADRDGKLLTFLRRELSLSSSLVKRLKWQGAFLVNGQSVHTDHPVKPGDVILVELEEAAPEFPAEDGPLEILYEDEALIAVDKPAGIMMHPTFYRIDGTLANRLTGYYQKTGQACAVHPVSRLDRDTFGVTLFAKNAHIHGRMMAQMKEGLVEKTYLALTAGCPEEDQGQWNWFIGRKEGESLLRQVDPSGQRAVTRFRVLERREPLSLLQLQPVTGRTHQLRVHCAYAGCPIAGDPQYGGQAACYAPHQQLLAWKLQFSHPLTGCPVTVVSKQGFDVGVFCVFP